MTEPRPLTEHGKPHGKMSSWILVAVVVAAFLVGGVAMILHWWVVFWVCVGVVVLSVPIGTVVGIMDDTVGWTLPMSARQRHQHASISGAAEEVRRERMVDGRVESHGKGASDDAWDRTDG